jgi:hypothetical protein
MNEQKIQDNNKAYSIFRSAGEKKKLLLMFNDLLLVVTPITLGPAKVKKLFLYNSMEVRKPAAVQQAQSGTMLGLASPTTNIPAKASFEIVNEEHHLLVCTESESIAEQWIKDLTKLCADNAALQTHRFANVQDALIAIHGGRTRVRHISEHGTSRTNYSFSVTDWIIFDSKGSIQRSNEYVEK